MKIHGRRGWLYLGTDGPPVIVQDWELDLSQGTLRPAVVNEAVPFRLYPVADGVQAPPLPGDQHFWGTLGPGGKVTGTGRHPSQVNPAIKRCPWDPAEPRELVGRLVRQVWLEWAREQSGPKPSWLLPWEELDDGQREADMRIGEALFNAGYEAGHEAGSQAASR